MVSCDFIAGNEDISPVICAPVYGEMLGLASEVVIGPEENVEGVVRQRSIRCDFLMLMFKRKLTAFVATLSEEKRVELRRPLAHALQLDGRCMAPVSLRSLRALR